MFSLVLICVGICFIGAIASSIHRGNLAGKALQVRRDHARAIAEAILHGLKIQRLPEAVPRRALMRPGETAVVVSPAHLLEIKTVGYRRSGTSVHYRVAKGVSVGSYSGRSSAVKALTRTADGEFVVTTQRVIFAGDAKSFEISLKRLTNIEPYSDGFGLHHGTATHTVEFDAPELAGAMATVLKLVAEGHLTIALTAPDAAVAIPATLGHPA